MLFPTLAFGVFFLIVYFTAWSLDRENGKRKLFLLLASWFFYAQWDWRFVGLLIASARNPAPTATTRGGSARKPTALASLLGRDSSAVMGSPR